MRIAAIAFTLLAACNTITHVDTYDSGVVRQLATAENPYIDDFVMGKNDQLVGQVPVWNDLDDLTVGIRLMEGFGLVNAHLCVSLTPLAWTPPGQCAYHRSGLGNAASVDFIVPLADVGATCDDILYLQLSADVLEGQKQGGAYAGTFKGSITYSVGCEPPPAEGCTWSHGYWKHHDWPVDTLVIGSESYNHEELLALLQAPTRGDGSIILARQLIAALLNVAAGAGTTNEIDTAFADAHTWASSVGGRLPFQIHAAPYDLPNSAAFDEAVRLGALFDSYNNGEVGPGHCDEADETDEE